MSKSDMKAAPAQLGLWRKCAAYPPGTGTKPKDGWRARQSGTGRYID